MPSIVAKTHPPQLARHLSRHLDMASKPKLYYFPIQGRGEPIRLALAAAGVEFEDVVVPGPDAMKQDLDSYKFGQCPRFVDDRVDLCQSAAILRHIARRHGLYGTGLVQQAAVDEVMDGVNDVGAAIYRFIMDSKENPKAKATYWAEHADPASAAGPAARGAHFAYLSRILAKSGGGFVVGDGLTVADIGLAVMVELHCTVFGQERVAQAWPDLAAHHGRVMAQPRVAAYLAGPQRKGESTMLKQLAELEG